MTTENELAGLYYNLAVCETALRAIAKIIGRANVITTAQDIVGITDLAIGMTNGKGPSLVIYRRDAKGRLRKVLPDA